MEFTPAFHIFPAWTIPMIQKSSDLVLKYPRPIVIAILLCCIIHLVFTKIIDPQLYECYKNILGYEATLQSLKDHLEGKYQEFHWNDPKFCKAYLSLYAAYRELRIVAKRDYNGQIDPRNKQWKRFDIVKIPSE